MSNLMGKLVILIIAASLILSGCEPKPDYGQQLKKDIVILTTPAVDLRRFSTYHLTLDTITYFNNSPTGLMQCSTCGAGHNVLGTYPSVITAELNKNLMAAGYTSVAANQNPDLKIDISLYTNTHYRGLLYLTSNYYNALIISIAPVMADFGWDCEIINLQFGADMSALTTDAIDRAFAQSPYLKK